MRRTQIDLVKELQRHLNQSPAHFRQSRLDRIRIQLIRRNVTYFATREPCLVPVRRRQRQKLEETRSSRTYPSLALCRSVCNGRQTRTLRYCCAQSPSYSDRAQERADPVLLHQAAVVETEKAKAHRQHLIFWRARQVVVRYAHHAHVGSDLGVGLLRRNETEVLLEDLPSKRRSEARRLVLCLR